MTKLYIWTRRRKSKDYNIAEGNKIFKTGKVEDLTVKINRGVKKKFVELK